MSTNAYIAVVNEDSTVSVIYNHWDGYPSGLGKHLKTHYTVLAEVQKLIAGGDISGFHQDDRSPLYYAKRGEWGQKGKAENEDWTDVKPTVFGTIADFEKEKSNLQVPFLYVFEDGVWNTFGDE